MHHVRAFPVSCLSMPLLIALSAGLAGSAVADVVQFIPPAPQEEGHFGEAVGGIPDLNNDGLDDVIVAAPDEDHVGFTNNGRVFIYSGRTGGQIRIHLSPNAANDGNFGHAVIGIEDLNGDGRGDYLVGAPGENGFRGRVYVYSGAAGTLLRTHTSPNAETGGRFGWAVAAIADVTGDSVRDYIIGAPIEDVGGITDAGRAYVFNGATGALVRSVNSPNPKAFGDFGHSVTGGRQAADGAAGKYAVGAPGENASGQPIESGRAYAFDGASGVLIRSYGPTGANQGARFGQCVAALPDFFGNGRIDLAIGAPYQNVTAPKGGSGLGAGSVEILSFGPGSNSIKFNQPPADVSDSNHFGYAIAGIPDMNGDGRCEVLVGAPADLRAYRYTYSPGDTPPLDLLETLTTPDQFGLLQYWSGAIAAVPDANGDGFGDFVIGGRGSDDFPNDPREGGRAQLHRPVYNDGCGTLFSALPVLVNGTNAVSTVGASGSSPIAICGGWSGSPGPDTWYRYTATCAGTVTFSTCNPGFDTLLAIYDGCTYSGPFLTCNLSVLLDCNDDDANCPGNGSRVTVDAAAGDCFFVRLAGFNGSSGIATMTVACEHCDGDLNGDGTVNAADLSSLLAGWGMPQADLNGDNTTNASDLSILLAAWGPCG